MKKMAELAEKISYNLYEIRTYEEANADFIKKNGIQVNNIKNVINDFFENNPINTKLLIQDERNLWKTKTENYF
jgi:hypothetical protein